MTSKLIKKAYEQEESTDFTDDASVVERLGQVVTMVEGNRENIKITTPFDLKVAEALLIHNHNSQFIIMITIINS